MTRRLMAMGLAALLLGGMGIAGAQASHAAPARPSSASADRVMTRLPAGFPKNPTAVDILGLGLTADSKVSPNLRIPQAAGTPLTEAKLPDTVLPVRVADTTVETVQSGTGPIQRTYHWVEWELTGGDGALVIPDKDLNTGEIHDRYVRLSPNGTTRVTTPMYDRSGQNADDFGNDPGRSTYYFPGFVVPDYGQTDLPQSTTRDWNLMDSRAMDESGRGWAAGKYANTEYPTWARPDRHPTDGWVNLDDTTHQIVGAPNW